MIVTEYEVGPGAYGVARGRPSSAVRLDQHGSITQEIGFEPGAEPHGIALGPGRSVWIALEAGALIHLTESD